LVGGVSEVLRYSRCQLLLLEAGTWGRWHFANPEEEERPLLEAVTRRLVKARHAEKNCVLQWIAADHSGPTV
jgi:hypothetical protein